VARGADTPWYVERAREPTELANDDLDDTAASACLRME